MLRKFNAIPVLPRLLIVLVALGLVYRVFHHSPRNDHDRVICCAFPRNGGEQAVDPPAETGSDGRSQLLGTYQAQYAQLQERAKDCAQQMTEATNRQAMAAMNGEMYSARPACEAEMPQIIAQEAFLETEMYKLQGGDPNASVREVSGIAPPQYGSSSAYSSSPSDSGTDAVERFDRQAIRGNSLYTDETGEERELPTRNYYFRDRVSGALIGSDSPNPPNNGRDYEVIEPQPQQ